MKGEDFLPPLPCLPSDATAGGPVSPLALPTTVLSTTRATFLPCAATKELLDAFRPPSLIQETCASPGLSVFTSRLWQLSSKSTPPGHAYVLFLRLLLQTPLPSLDESGGGKEVTFIQLPLFRPLPYIVRGLKMVLIIENTPDYLPFPLWPVLC